MAISDRRVRYIDKENEVLVKDFGDIKDNEQVYSNYPSYIYDDNIISQTESASRDLMNLQQGFMNLINSLTDGVISDYVIRNILNNLVIKPGTFGYLSNILNILKLSNNSVINDFIRIVIRDVGNILYDNPSLLNNYKGISKDVTTQVVLYSLDNYGNQLTNRITSPTYTPTSYTNELIDLGLTSNNSTVNKLVTGLSLSSSVINPAIPLFTTYATLIPYVYTLYVLTSKINLPINISGNEIHNNFINNDTSPTDLELSSYTNYLSNAISINKSIDIYYSEVYSNYVTNQILDYVITNSVTDELELTYYIDLLYNLHESSLEASGSMFLKLPSLDKYYTIINLISDTTDIDNIDKDTVIKELNIFINDTLINYFSNIKIPDEDTFIKEVSDLSSCLFMTMLTKLYESLKEIDLSTIDINKLFTYVKDMSNYYRFYLSNYNIPYLNIQKTVDKDINNPLCYFIDIYKQVNNYTRTVTITDKSENVKYISIVLYKFMIYLNNTNIQDMVKNVTDRDDKLVLNSIIRIKTYLLNNTSLQSLINTPNINFETDYVNILDNTIMENIYNVFISNYKETDYPKTFFFNYTSNLSKLNVQTTSLKLK